jgi:hypothetical protein
MACTAILPPTEMIEGGNTLTIKVVVRRRTSTHLIFSALLAENPGKITPLDHEFTCIHDEVATRPNGMPDGEVQQLRIAGGDFVDLRYAEGRAGYGGEEYCEGWWGDPTRRKGDDQCDRVGQRDRRYATFPSPN